MLQYIARIWRKAPFYLVTIEESSPQWRKIHTLQFPSIIDVKSGLEIAERFRQQNYPSHGWVCTEVRKTVKHVWEDQAGQVPDVPSSYMMGSHRCDQRSTPIIKVQMQ
jgi:hypothetical protein